MIRISHCIVATYTTAKKPAKSWSKFNFIPLIITIKSFEMLDRTLLKAGLSKPWRVTLMEAIGTDELDASAVLDYFQPLSDYLDEEIKKGGEQVGWDLHYEDFYRSRGRFEEPDINNTVPIIVGCVLAALVVIVIIAYFIGRSRNQKKRKQLNGHDNPTSVTLE